jgi:hypothetical protein
MRKALTIGALAALLVLLASTALAGTTRTYKGGIEGDEPSKVTLKVKVADDERKVKSFTAKKFLIACGDEQARLESATISGLVAVDGKGRFEVTGSNEGQELKVAGDLTGKRNATGTVRYSGPTLVDGETRDCDSGKLEWRASR